MHLVAWMLPLVHTPEVFQGAEFKRPATEHGTEAGARWPHGDGRAPRLHGVETAGRRQLTRTSGHHPAAVSQLRLGTVCIDSH